MTRPASIQIRNTRAGDFAGITDLCRRVYPDTPPWTSAQLAGHLERFPQGQLVAIETRTERVLGMASSLVVRWDDYEATDTWKDFTAGGTFANHDMSGHTLYGAEVMVDPQARGFGVGKRLYAARRALCRRYGLLRIRAGARLRGYHRVADRMSALEYTLEVVRGRLGDATLSFQLRQGFRVLQVVSGYLSHDPESLGWAAVIEWINSEVARRRHIYRRPNFFNPLGVSARR